MKKLLVLMLVLGMASLASAVPVPFADAVAAAFEFTVEGEAQSAEVTINVGDSIDVGLNLLANHTSGGIDLTWKLSNASAQLLTGAVTVANFDMGLSVSPADAQTVKIFGGQIFMPDKAGLLSLVDLLEVECLTEGDVTLDIVFSGTTSIDGTKYYSTEVPVGTVVHSLLIHQVPEPATVVLLSLGGLLLRRKK